MPITELKVDDIKSAAHVVANQREYPDDIKITFPEGFQIKGIVCKAGDRSNAKLVTINTADTIPVELALVHVGVLAAMGEVFLTHVGVPPEDTTRRWSRLKPKKTTRERRSSLWLI